jgi:septal ring factor EnvC (AmiA/AmiB activator)
MKNQEHKKGLEQFIQNHRQDLDRHEVPVGLWDKIDKSLGKEIIQNPEPDEVVFKFKKSSISKLKIWAMAASLVLLIGYSLAFYLNNKSDSTEQIVAEVAPQYGDRMVQYTSLIESKREEIKQIETHDPMMYKEFATEIEKLNQDYQSLQTELSQTPNQEDLVKAMIQNLQVQLDILNRQLKIIEKVKQYQKNPTKSV